MGGGAMQSPCILIGCAAPGNSLVSSAAFEQDTSSNQGPGHNDQSLIKVV